MEKCVFFDEFQDMGCTTPLCSRWSDDLVQSVNDYRKNNKCEKCKEFTSIETIRKIKDESEKKKISLKHSDFKETLPDHFDYIRQIILNPNQVGKGHCRNYQCFQCPFHKSNMIKYNNQEIKTNDECGITGSPIDVERLKAAKEFLELEESKIIASVKIKN